MLAGHHDARRQDHAALLHAKYADHPAVVYVDAARYDSPRDAFVVVVPEAQDFQGRHENQVRQESPVNHVAP
ncbi:hypothetical protein HPB52_012949 [Rhipicephalus sanguineus]|uniref:Uncharacterized protein n=1 Tax=Rhipicephalus sanguineus TaxID=34632 RepID=A0A9D4SUY7_RHISA|nr:hypothetical protein HPB52_012949 [Rhipicephalus sanguineus]